MTRELLPIKFSDHPDFPSVRWTELEIQAIQDYARRAISLKVESLPVNHEEAKSLAFIKHNESNLARCYLDLVNKMELQEKPVLSLIEALENCLWIPK